MLSSSLIAVPDIPVFNTALVRVLFVRVCDPVRVATVESILNFIVWFVPTVSIPVPPSKVNVWESNKTDWVRPLSPVKFKLSPEILLST